MFIVLGSDGNEYGPATAAQILGWKRDGRVNGETMLRRPGEVEWHPLEEFPEFSSRPPGMTPPTLPPPLPEGADLIEVPREKAKLDILSCYEQSWNLFRADAWPLIGTCVIVIVFQLVAAIHPALSFAFSLILSGAIGGGLLYVFTERIRGNPARPFDLFDGLRTRPAPLILASMIRSLLEVTALFPFMLYFSGQAVPVWLLALSGLAGLFVTLAYPFAFLLIIDRGLRPWEALEASRRMTMARPFRMLLLALIALSLLLLGLIAFGIGILVAMPLVAGAYAYAYLKLTGER